MTPREPNPARNSIARVAILAGSLGVAVGFLLARIAIGIGSGSSGAVAGAAPGSAATDRASAPDGPPAAAAGGTNPAPTPIPEGGASLSTANARAALEELLRLDSPTALERALAETHRGRRQFLVHALVRHWAGKSPAEALQWALARPAGEREATLSAVIAGAAAKPEDAVFLVSQLCAAEPAYALERGSALIAALAEHGHFSEAARFAARVDPAHREAWTGAAFARWAEWDPKAASHAALASTDPVQRELALRAAITGWAPNEPASLADFALRLPAGETRTYALGEAMRQWIDADPVAASAWIEHFEPTRELDNAVAAIAQQPYLAERRPDVALSWAESIVDRGVRASTLAALVQSWGQRDSTAARRFVESNRDFSDEERKDLLAVLGR